jgi:signal transduction histidine kinase
MPARWLELFRTTSARLALLYAGLFAVSVGVLFGLVYWAATAALSDRIDQDLAVERDAVIAEAGTAEDRVVAVVADALQRSHRGFRYQVRDAAGGTLAGNLPQRPWHGGYQDAEIPSENSRADPESHLFRVLGQPLDQGGLLVIAQDAYALDELRELIVRAFGWGAAATLLLAGIGGGIMVSRVMYRVEVINRASERMMAGDLTGRLPVTGRGGRGDEFDRLSHNLNGMLERIEKLVEGLRQISTDIAHDLRTPLTRLRRSLETLRIGIAPEACSAHLAGLDKALTQTDELLATFASLLRIAQIESRGARFVFATVDLSEIAQAVLEVYRPAAEEKRQELQGHIPDSVCVAGDRALLTQMAANLAENAIRHAPEGAWILIALQPRSEAGPSLTITDNGPGIPQSEHRNVFRRFYRLDASRGTPGNGLGLSLVEAVADLHGLSVRLDGNIPQGLKVTVEFPPMDVEDNSESGAAPRRGNSPDPPERGRHKPRYGRM